MEQAIVLVWPVLGVLNDDISDDTVHDIAARLHEDAILFGLFSRMMRETPQANPYTIADNVIGEFVQRAAGDLAEEDTPATEYLFVLDALARHMIRNKNLHSKSCDGRR